MQQYVMSHTSNVIPEVEASVFNFVAQIITICQLQSITREMLEVVHLI